MHKTRSNLLPHLRKLCHKSTHHRELKHLADHHVNPAPLKSSRNVTSHHRSRLPHQKKLSHLGQCKRVISDAAAGMKEWEHFIKDNTEVSHDHLTPEITLRLITPRCRLWSVPYAVCEGEGVTDPYWAFYWPGGQALTRFLIDNPEIVNGKAVLDIGSGCGASAIGCVKSGATRVMANDIDPVSIQAIKMNAALNDVTIETSLDNFIGCHNDINNWDIILLGDMFYDQNFTDLVSDWLKYLTSCKINVLIGDPGRIYLQNHPIKKQLRKVFEVELPEQSRLENNGLTQGFVWQLIQGRT